ncbi:MAG: hypothetical protein ROZ64_03570 [Burkholderiaceae bacterium]|nr:hypothetical protein [Burkholderiaceae bacterium]
MRLSEQIEQLIPIFGNPQQQGGESFQQRFPVIGAWWAVGHVGKD